MDVPLLKKTQVYAINLKKNPVDKLKKKSRFARPGIFLRFDADVDFSIP